MIINCINIEFNVKVLISEAILHRMVEVGNHFYPKEFGGILLGTKEKDFWLIVDIETPRQFESSEKTFLRHPNFLNSYLEKLYEKSNSRIEYLGEWHTHPNGDTKFSKQDFLSMQEIANDPKTKNGTPLLAIIKTGLSPKFQFYSFQNDRMVHLKTQLLIETN